MTQRFPRSFLNSFAISFAVVSFAGCMTPPDGPPDTEPDADQPIADLSVATPDGNASYRLRFFAGEGNAIATLVDVPAGYAKPLLDEDCALDTYLRVAPADAAIPPALVAACPRTPAQPLVQSVADLEPPERGLVFDASAAPTEPLCAKSAFDNRVDELEKLAAYQPTIYPYHLECDSWVGWDGGGCVYHDNGGNLQCDDAYYQSLISTYGPEGYLCFHQTLVADPPHLDAACAHPEWIFNDWGPWTTWERASVAANISKTRAEISVCGTSGAKAYWQTRQSTDVPWGAQHKFDINGNGLSILTLSAGSVGAYYDKWDFRIHAAGSQIRAASAWVDMSANKHADCPMKI